MTSIYDKNFRKFAFIFEKLQVLQCEKMKFRNAWPRRDMKVYLEVQCCILYRIFEYYLTAVVYHSSNKRTYKNLTAVR